MPIQTVVKESPLPDTSSLINDNTVSVVIPCYNEERFIGKALEQLAGQFPTQRYEIIVVDGLSNDRTRVVISEFQQRHPDLRVSIVDNPARNIPTALNLGVSAARGNIIARMDAHAVPCAGYIQRCVDGLARTTAGAVGMPCIVQPGADTLMARAIAIAVSHPFGIGDAKYRLGAAGPEYESVDTVAFACFRKELWRELGGFNESLLTNEDYEFNYRIRQSGRTVVLDRTGHSQYFARTTLAALAQQYWRYGGWKARMVRLQPRSIKVRHMVAPVFVLSLVGLAVASVFWRPARWLLFTDLIAYILATMIAAWHATSGDGPRRILFLMPLIFATIHLTWGSSFLLHVLTPEANRRL